MCKASRVSFGKAGDDGGGEEGGGEEGGGEEGGSKVGNDVDACCDPGEKHADTGDEGNKRS